MNFTPTNIAGAWFVNSSVHDDDRGSFQEWFKQGEILKATGFDFSVAQANVSESKLGVVRGIHYSLSNEGQAKWVTCVKGAIRDVVVDIRRSSPTYSHYVAVDLVGGDGQSILIGSGLGHGFISLEEGSIVSYLLASPYSPGEEFEINPLDSAIGIDWGMPSQKMIFSTKDSAAPSLSERLQSQQLPS